MSKHAKPRPRPRALPPPPAAEPKPPEPPVTVGFRYCLGCGNAILQFSVDPKHPLALLPAVSACCKRTTVILVLPSVPSGDFITMPGKLPELCRVTID